MKSIKIKLTLFVVLLFCIMAGRAQNLTVTLDPAIPCPGSTVKVSVTGITSGTKLTVKFDGGKTTTVMTNVFMYAIPSPLSAATHTISVTATLSQGAATFRYNTIKITNVTWNGNPVSQNYLMGSTSATTFPIGQWKITASGIVKSCTTSGGALPITICTPCSGTTISIGYGTNAATSFTALPAFTVGAVVCSGSNIFMHVGFNSSLGSNAKPVTNSYKMKIHTNHGDGYYTFPLFE